MPTNLLSPAARRTGTFAPRMRVWPPEGYVAPTASEFAKLRATAARFAQGGMFQSRWDRMDDSLLARQRQLIELAGGNSRALTEYAREVRRQMDRRGLVHRSIAVPRCESCSHATERLFEATQTTHPGLKHARTGALIESAWFCARCWSGDDADGGEGADEC